MYFRIILGVKSNWVDSKMFIDLINFINVIECLELIVKGLEEWKISVVENMDEMFLVIMGIIIYCK